MVGSCATQMPKVPEDPGETMPVCDDNDKEDANESSQNSQLLKS
jgi:hypothetical protein